jgi:hypothetical protein
VRTDLRVQLRQIICPCCGARLSRGSSQQDFECDYCGALLRLDATEITGEPTPPPPPQTSSQAKAPVEEVQLSSHLFQHATAEFELSMLRQPLSETELPLQESISETFECISVTPQTCNTPNCFAFVYLRIVDKENGRPCIGIPLPTESIQESLNLYSDPGLAACSALEWLCHQPTGFGHRLEVCISLFDPLRCSVTVYSAGCSDSSLVLSNEEGRIIDFSRRNQSGLEKKHLRDGDIFQNSEPIYLDAYDRYLFLSAACSGRGGVNYDGALNAIYDCLREEVGEDPLRLVTLAKNAFWKGRSASARGHLPVGPVMIAAVRACQRPLVPLANTSNLQEFGSSKYALLARPLRLLRNFTPTRQSLGLCLGQSGKRWVIAL